MDTTTSSVIDTFKQVMLHKVENMDNKMFNYWTNAIRNKDKTLEDFKTFLLKSQDYQSLLRNTFMDVFYEKLSDTNFYDLYESFIKYHADREVSLQDILEFITNSHYFIEKYRPIITTIYEAVKGDLPDEQMVYTYLQKFKSVKDYDIEKLQDDIKYDRSMTSEVAGEEIACQNTEDLEGYESIEEELEDMSEDDRDEFLDLLGSKNRLLEWYKETKQRLAVAATTPAKSTEVVPSDHLTFVDVFERLFGRNMNVREYIFYMPEYSTHEKHVLENEIAKLKKQYDHVFENVNLLLEQFLDKRLDEDEFIRQHLSSIRHPEFLQDLKMSIIHSKEYSDKMMARLSHLYEKLYDEMLTPEDAAYLFDRITLKEYALQSDQLNNEIVEYKNDTDKLIERIFSIFVETYDREPDTYEIQKYIGMYRESDEGSLDAVDAAIQKELRDSLEFHDVIKSRIKKVYSTMFDNKILSPSMTYQVLKKILDNKAHQKDLDAIIQKYIQEL